jgi:hypothetical protein
MQLILDIISVAQQWRTSGAKNLRHWRNSPTYKFTGANARHCDFSLARNRSDAQRSSGYLSYVGSASGALATQ